MRILNNSANSSLDRLYFASFLSGLGNWMTSLVIFGWVYHKTSSPLAVGLGILAHRLPMSIGAWVFSGRTEATPGRWRVLSDLVRFSILLLIVFLTRFEPFSTDWNVAIFLSLAALRSLFSGTDAGIEAKLISNHSTTQDHAASNQLVLSYLFGLNGFIASMLFCLGLLNFSYSAVLVFDAATFLLSAIAIYGLDKYQPETIALSPRDEGGGLFQAFGSQPKVWAPVLLHVIRNLSMCVVMQESLLLYKVKFHAGEESSGYLYMALTLGWFVSSKIRSRWQLNLAPIKIFYGLTFLVCLLAPLAWIFSSAVVVFCFVFFVSCMDGFASSGLSAFMQKNVQPSYLGRIFSFHSMASNLTVVLGSLVIGYLSNGFGFLLSSVWVALFCLAALLLVPLARAKSQA